MAEDSPSPAPLTSARLDRSALERVLARAAELQAAGGEAGDDFSEQQILDLGKEVGLSPQHLRQALAEERTRVPLPDGGSRVARQLLGPGRIGASRTVPGTPAAALAAINAWMQREQWLQVKRQFPDRIVWEPRHDIAGALRRVFRVGGHGYELSRAHEIAATAVAVDGERALVRLDADFSSQRSTLVRNTAAGTAVGLAGSAALAVMGFTLLAVPLPALAFGIGTFSSSRAAHKHSVDRAQLALEQMLDRLERSEATRPPSLLGILSAATMLPSPPKRSF